MEPTSQDAGFSLGQLIRRHRVAAGLSQFELAERSGLSARAISDLERGQRSTARLESVRMLADGLELTEHDRVTLLAAARPGIGLLSDSQDAGHGSLSSTALPLRLKSPPVPLTALIGRVRATADIAALLANPNYRLITLLGPGGVGKTRLAIAAATEVAPQFGEGIAFIDLSPLQSPELVARAIASGLGLAEEAGVHPLDVLCTALRWRSPLLILDTFEHVLDAATDVARLLAVCPHLKILATSRSRLHLRGEQLVHVAPLDIPPRHVEPLSVSELSSHSAVQLFLERTRAVDSTFDPSDLDGDAIGEICRRLDGLPLAIELAASRLSIYTPHALLERLDRLLPALGGGPRDAPDRQKRLSDTVAWSYQLLEPSEQRAFRRLAVTVGGFTLDGAMAIVSEPEEQVAVEIEELVESSLLTTMSSVSGDRRFRMLDTVREFASTLLAESGERALVRRQHADWCLRMARTAGDELLMCRDEAMWFRRLDGEQPNLRSAIDFLLETGDGDSVIQMLAATWGYWTERPFPHDLIRWLDAALEMALEPPGPDTVLALGLLVNARSFLGEHERASSIANQQLRLAESIGTPMTLGLAWFWQGITTDYAGDVQRAAVAFERALSYHRQAGYTFPILESMLEVGSISLIAGKIEQAVDVLDESLVVARRAGTETELAYGLLYRGFAALAQEDAARAAEFFAESLRIAQRYQMDRVSLGAIGGLAGVSLTEGQPKQAARLLGAVEAARESSGVGRICQASQVDAIVFRTIDALGPDAFERYTKQGSMTTYEDAISVALDRAAPVSDPE